MIREAFNRSYIGAKDDLDTRNTVATPGSENAGNLMPPASSARRTGRVDPDRKFRDRSCRFPRGEVERFLEKCTRRSSRPLRSERDHLDTNVQHAAKHARRSGREAELPTIDVVHAGWSSPYSTRAGAAAIQAPRLRPYYPKDLSPKCENPRAGNPRVLSRSRICGSQQRLERT